MSHDVGLGCGTEKSVSNRIVDTPVALQVLINLTDTIAAATGDCVLKNTQLHQMLDSSRQNTRRRMRTIREKLAECRSVDGIIAEGLKDIPTLKTDLLGLTARNDRTMLESVCMWMETMALAGATGLTVEQLNDSDLGLFHFQCLEMRIGSDARLHPPTETIFPSRLGGQAALEEATRIYSSYTHGLESILADLRPTWVHGRYDDPEYTESATLEAVFERAGLAAAKASAVATGVMLPSAAAQAAFDNVVAVLGVYRRMQWELLGNTKYAT
jgi:hypothetical protein